MMYLVMKETSTADLFRFQVLVLWSLHMQQIAFHNTQKKDKALYFGIEELASSKKGLVTKSWPPLPNPQDFEMTI